MKLILGIIIVFGCVMGGYLPHGSAAVLNQPLEFLIIVGAAVGAFVITNPGHIIKGSLAGVKCLLKGSVPHKKKDYIELLSFLFATFKVMKTKGILEIESHIENPHESSIFSQFPAVQHNHHVMDFFCDNIRLLTMGVDSHYLMEDLMNAELDVHHEETHAVNHALTLFGDSLPALGIVAAVLGVITTMGSISEPPEILGGLIGAALVGTFAGILLSYGIFAPIAASVTQYNELDGRYYEVVKAAILAHMQGNAPSVSVEFARKSVPMNAKPSFAEMEEALSTL